MKFDQRVQCRFTRVGIIMTVVVSATPGVDRDRGLRRLECRLCMVACSTFYPILRMYR